MTIFQFHDVVMYHLACIACIAHLNAALCGKDIRPVRLFTLSYTAPLRKGLSNYWLKTL